MDSKRSRSIAGLVGPAVVAMVVSEFPLVQPRLYEAQIPPVVYLSGTLLFVAGLAIVRAHNVWTRAWPVLVTLVGWSAVVLGLVRMFAASQYREAAATSPSAVFIVAESILLVVGLVLTFQGWRESTP
jgi:hypothetical protein